MVVMAVVKIPARKIAQALDAKIKEMRDGSSHPIEYINGFEDAATMVARVIQEAGTRGPG